MEDSLRKVLSSNTQGIATKLLLILVQAVETGSIPPHRSLSTDPNVPTGKGVTVRRERHRNRITTAVVDGLNVSRFEAEPLSLEVEEEEMVSSLPPVMNIYSLSNYTFGDKEPKPERDASVADRFARMKEKYKQEGIMTSVAGILLVQEHNHPHLLLGIGKTFRKLPGGRLRQGENEIEGLKRKLTSKLGASLPNLVPDWQIGECVARWWRPNFEEYMYPYCPPHMTKPKECRMIYMVHLSEWEYFEVPKNLTLVAVPMFQLYDNAQRYGSIISSIPEQLSRFEFMMNNN